MKKALIFFIIQILGFVAAQAQINWGEYAQIYQDGVTDNTSKVGLILALRKGNDFLWSIRAKSVNFRTVDRDPSFTGLLRKNILARTTFDTANAQFFLHGVSLKNAHDYQFRVLEYPGNRELVAWHSINQFTGQALIKSSGMPSMAYLGGYKASFGKMLILDVRETKHGHIIASSLVAWESIKPTITNVYTSNNLDELLSKLQYPWSPTEQSSNSTPQVLTVPSTNSDIVFALKGEISGKEQVQYQLLRNESLYTLWRYNDYGNSFVWIKSLPPGAYTIRIRFSVQPANVTEYHFVVEPAWYQTHLFKIIAGIFFAALMGAFLFLMLFIRQRQKTRIELANKTKSQLELKAIYAQLNPHFVFNALSSIQGLINKQDINGANTYLTDFARLMRESLTNSNKEEISIKEEVTTLGTYLKLEQLRFGFKYNILVSPSINIYETNIPTLLLQPIVENAVKHGAATMQEAGQIEIAFERVSEDMVITITDNGPGFDKQETVSGYGLKLTQDRIKLLNSLNLGQPVSLAFGNTSKAGTQVTLTFKQWFL
jgi:two-component system LytT family sensor kinase